MDNIFVRGPRVTPLPGGSKTNWAVGAKPKLADELKTELDASSENNVGVLGQFL